MTTFYNHSSTFVNTTIYFFFQERRKNCHHKHLHQSICLYSLFGIEWEFYGKHITHAMFSSFDISLIYLRIVFCPCMHCNVCHMTQKKPYKCHCTASKRNKLNKRNERWSFVGFCFERMNIEKSNKKKIWKSFCYDLNLGEKKNHSDIFSIHAKPFNKPLTVPHRLPFKLFAASE